MFRIIALAFIQLGISVSLQAQMVKGKVTDDNGDGLAFTTIYTRGTTNGSSTNYEGDYFLELAPGKHQIVFQYIGYERQIFEVDLKEKEQFSLDVQLQPEAIQLREFVVTGDGKDPAFYIIGQAIRKRKYHLNEVSAYKCNVYIKGMQTIDKKPDKVLGFRVPIDTGIVYLSESISELYFMQPDKIKERVIASKVSGDNKAFSYNQASEMMVNFYENILTAEGLTERGIISPIASNAFAFYNYELVSIDEENGEVINKIRVIPKRKNDPVFSGYIYILEDSWRIHSVDLLLTKDNQIEFLDNLSIKQVYAPVDPGIWMMLSQKFTFDLSVFGFEGQGNFMAVHSKYEVAPAYPLENYKDEPKDVSSEPPTVNIAKRAANPENEVANKPDDVLPEPKKFFNNEILIVEDQSNKKDESYWQEVRPVPLTKIEKVDYQFKDSIRVIIESKPFKDSMDVLNNKLSIENVLLSGYVHRNSFRERYFSIDPLANILQFNTVEGAVINMKLLYTQLRETQPFFRIIPELRYGFASEEFYGRIRGVYLYNMKNFGRFDASGGKFISQFNDGDPIKPWINSAYTLLLRENYMKIYEKSFFRLMHQQEYANGFFVETALEYEDRRQLANASDFSFFREDNKNFTPNAPENLEVSSTSFPQHQALTFSLLFKIRFAQKYISRPERKYIVETKYPQINVLYKKGLAVAGSDINYDLIEFNVAHDIDYGLFGSGAITASYGSFFNNNRMYFPDFKHFNGSRVHLTDFQPGNYQLLSYYQFSTRKEYLSTTYAHHFNGFIINKLPLVRKTKVQVVATANYLRTKALGNYIEAGLGIEHIFKIGRVDYYRSFIGGRYDVQGLRIGIGF